MLDVAISVAVGGVAWALAAMVLVAALMRRTRHRSAGAGLLDEPSTDLGAPGG